MQSIVPREPAYPERGLGRTQIELEYRVLIFTIIDLAGSQLLVRGVNSVPVEVLRDELDLVFVIHCVGWKGEWKGEWEGDGEGGGESGR